ncbi:MAG: nitrite/sulfite reductase [Actinobacteria bacterium]|uniref:assimilatory sulfite reductase (ferredoxin) n=1 Tax=Nostocoides veronense TaxID=330836 RepID=A0ABN2LDH9_9MICO|nr:nitrite/sulfite reductase [Actinomycetota bacterium]
MTETIKRPTRTQQTGAWADGDRTPLNGNEVLKQADDALNVRQRIIDIYSKQGFASIPGDDLRGRFRWMGLYTQRKEGIDGGQTATLEPEELDAEYFMMRVRSDGGILSTEQLRTIGQISTDFGRDTADISDRQNIQLHWIGIEDVPEIWDRLERVGLHTLEACGDAPRVIIGSPVAGIAADEIVDGTWAIEQIRSKYIGSPEFSNLPRKFKTAISGSPAMDVVHEINDVSFVGVNHPELGPGFDLWVGGGLSVAPMFAKRLGAFVRLEQVPDVWAGVIGIFRDYGYRRLRNRARLKFLMADIGPEKFRDILETEYLGYSLPDGPEPVTPPDGHRDHVGVHKQKDGKVWIGTAPIAGRVSGTILREVADLAERYGSTRIRLTPHQKLLVLDIEEADATAIIEELAAYDLIAKPSVYRRNVLACTGIEYCKLGLTDTKDRARKVVVELERRRPEMDVPFGIHVNGCPNACARTQVGDIGLKGMVQRDENDELQEVFQVHLGGGLGVQPSLARKTRALKVAAEDLPDYIDRVAGRYLEQRSAGESFAVWAHRADEEDLR